MCTILLDNWLDILYSLYMETNTMTNQPKQWVVVEQGTNYQVAGPYSTKVRATRKADKLDLTYGAIHYAVVESAS